MKNVWYAGVLVLALGGSLQAQEPPITPDTPVDSSVLHQWLHSGDPRLIAWAADFARRRHDAGLLAEMPGLLETWPIPHEFGEGESQAAQRRALFAVLDALVQENYQVPIHAIEVVAPAFPAQASLLIARYPLSQSRRTLEYWASRTTGSWADLARIASMMLAKDPTPSTERLEWREASFVASVVAASQSQLGIVVSASKSVGPGVGSGWCGDSLGHPPVTGWPEVYAYSLEENETQSGASVVVELNDDRIGARRFKENGGWGQCSSQQVEPLNARTRHRLIAYWLGVHDTDMSWQSFYSFVIIWRNESSYKRRLGEIVASQRQKLQSTVEALRRRGFLTNDEANKVVPSLVLTIQCDMNPCPLSEMPDSISRSQ